MATLSGVALLDTGAPASLVLVRDWDGYQHIAAVVPAADGSWSVTVTAGRNYEVTMRGPTHYQPVTDGPIAVGD